MTKAMYTTNNGIKEEILIGSDSEFYKDIAERLIKESVSNGTRVKVNVDVPDEGDASYMVSQRSGTMFITETGNNMPDKFLDKEIKPRFLTCVNPETNIRDSRSATWKDVVYTVLRELDHSASLEEIYDSIEGHEKCNSNIHWKAKVRQVLQSLAKTGKTFNVSRGVWACA